MAPKQEVIFDDFHENELALDPQIICNVENVEEGEGSENDWRPKIDEENENDDYYENPEEHEDESCSDSDDYTPSSSRRASPSKEKRGRAKKELKEKLSCNICGKGFPNRHGLSIHIGRSHGGKEIKMEKYICEVEGCGKEFTWKSSFTQHMAKHIDGRKFKCDICGKGN